MTPQLRFARYRDIAADVAIRLTTRGEDAIVASGGVASALTAAALQNAPSGAVSLRLLTIETFAREVLNDAGEYPRVATDAEQRLAMASAARLAAESILDTPALGALLQRSYRDVRDSGLPIDAFESRVRSASVRNRRRIETMIRAWREYERLITQLGATDPADVLLRAAHRIAEQGGAPQKPLVIAGFYDMTGAQLAIVHALAKAEKLAAIFVPAAEDEAFVTRFVSMLPSVELGTRDAALEIKSPSPTFTLYESRFTELREVCRAIKALLDGGARPSSIAIVARSLSAGDLHLINRFAGEFGFATNATEAVPLYGHRIGRAIRTLLRLRNRTFPRAEVIDVLRDGFRISRRISVDALDDATRRANIACGGSDAVRSRAGEYADVLAEIESFAPANPLSGAAWAGLLERILERFKLETDSDDAAADAITAIAALMRRAESWRRRFDADAVIDLLEQVSLAGATENDAPAIWIGDVMRSRGRTFDHVFAVRMEEDIFPQKRLDDPLLPDRDRRAAGLREIGDGRDEERLLFQLLSDAAATSIHYSVASSDGLGKLIRPSVFVRNAPHPRYAHPLPASGARVNERSRQLQLIAKSGTRSEFDGYLALDETIAPRIQAALGSLSPTHLEDFGECPQKFLLKRILGVRDLDEPERELHINQRDKGSIDHAILERFYRSLRPRQIEDAAASLPQLAPPLRDLLDGIIDEEFDKLDATMPPFNPAMRDIERRATKRHLHAFVADDVADLIESGLRPRDFEYAFGPKFVEKGVATRPEPFVYRADDLTLSIQGQIDRIDANGQQLRVVDYKSGKAMRHKDLAEKIDRGIRLQLPLYAIAVADFFGVDPTSISGAIKPLRGGDGAKYSFLLSDHTESLRETIAIFARAILDGSFPAFPNETDDFDSCKYCPVNHSCRTRHNDAEKYAVTRQGDPRTLLGT